MRSALNPSFKTIVALVLASLCSACGYSQKKMEPQSARPTAQQPGNGFAVIELFTSEGCSSCPPADALLPKLKEQYGDNLFILSFHVDYWNRLGWKDPFSSAEYSARQNRYAAAFKSENVYTPQAVVNGKAHITGSSRGGLEKLIRTELEGTKATSMQLSATLDGRSVTVAYETTLQSGEVLNVALVQRVASVAVRAGENGGRKLEHHSVVRDFETMRDGSGTVRLAVPDGLMADALAVVAYVQRTGTMHITGAGEVAVR